MRGPFTLVPLVLLLLVAACAGDDPGTDTAQGPDATTDPRAATATADSGVGDGTPSDPAADAALAADIEVDDASWSANATEHRERIGTRIAFTCPPGGDVHAVWGTSPYTDDSSVCTAAVHAGLISVEGGGRVVIEMGKGLMSYPSGEANGITTGEWPEWPGSFTFPGAR